MHCLYVGESQLDTVNFTKDPNSADQVHGVVLGYQGLANLNRKGSGVCRQNDAPSDVLCKNFFASA